MATKFSSARARELATACSLDCGVNDYGAYIFEKDSKFEPTEVRDYLNEFARQMEKRNQASNRYYHRKKNNATIVLDSTVNE